MHNQIMSRDEWLVARLGLLEEEKELTRRLDEVARRRQEMPGSCRQGLPIRER